MSNAVNIAQSGSIGYSTGFKNRIINGAFEVWQRGLGPTYLTAGVYATDRWTCMGYQNARHQRVAVTLPVTDLTARYANRVGSSTTAEASGGTRMVCDQKIESVNCYDLAGQTVTLSFWVRFSSNTFTSVANTTDSAFGNFNFYIAVGTLANIDSATSTDSIGAVYGVKSIINGSLPTTWTKVSTTVTLPASLGNVSVRMGMGSLGNTASASGNYYEVTQVQLEEGTVGTSFDYRAYQTELSLCQRYYQVIGGSNYTAIGSGGSISNIVSVVYIKLLTTMRTTPTVALTGNLIITDRTAYDAAVSSLSSFAPGTDSVSLYLNHGGTATAGKFAILAVASSVTGALQFSAEL